MVNVVASNVTRKVLSTLLKVVTIDGNWDNQLTDITLSFAIGQMKVAWWPMMHWYDAWRDPLMPWIEVAVGVRGGEFVPMTHDSSLKIWRSVPESKTQRELTWELAPRTEIVLTETSSSTSGTTMPSAGSIRRGEFKGAAESCMMVSRISRQT